MPSHFEIVLIIKIEIIVCNFQSVSLWVFTAVLTNAVEEFFVIRFALRGIELSKLLLMVALLVPLVCDAIHEAVEGVTRT